MTTTLTSCPCCGRPIGLTEVDWGTGGCHGHHDPTSWVCAICPARRREDCRADTPTRVAVTGERDKGTVTIGQDESGLLYVYTVHGGG